MTHEVPAVTLRQHLLADHRKVESLLEELLVAFQASDRTLTERLWNEFETRLEAHLEAEETTLIPALEKRAPRDARTLIEEHRHIRRRMLELGTALDLHLARFEMARFFVEELKAHASHEDELLYQWADQELSVAERQSFLSRMVNAILSRLPAAALI